MLVIFVAKLDDVTGKENHSILISAHLLLFWTLTRWKACVSHAVQRIFSDHQLLFSYTACIHVRHTIVTYNGMNLPCIAFKVILCLKLDSMEPGL